jgi:methyl-accepting chemotaxis protein
MGQGADPFVDARVTREELADWTGFGFLRKITAVFATSTLLALIMAVLAWQGGLGGLAIMVSIAGVTLPALALIWLVRPQGASWRLSYLNQTICAIAKGELKTPVYREGGDEIAQMGKALAVLRNVAWQAKTAMEETEKERSRADQERRNAELALADGFDGAVSADIGALSQNMGSLRDQAKQMQSMAEEANKESEAVASSSSAVMTDMEAVAAATGQLSSSISEISRQVDQSATIAEDAVKRADQMNANIVDLEAGSQKIGAVVSLINDIAEQTNLLALNATIEAARAGEAGKGFAVVASEVKNLANQTTSATGEIGSQITEIQAGISKAVEAAEAIGQVIGQIDDISGAIATAVEQQGAATEAISRTVSQATEATTGISSNIERITTASRQTGDAADDVLNVASRMEELAANLDRQVQKFLSDIRH